VKFRFKSSKLEELYTNERGAHKYLRSVVNNFFEVMSIIEAASNEGQLAQIRGLNLEKLGGRRKGQLSIRLSKQYRLIYTRIEDCLVILEISKHYQ